MNNNVLEASPEALKNAHLTEDEIYRSLKINQESKTPYSDATQVRTLVI